MSSAQDDLAYIRSIAEEGRNVPLVGGAIFTIWGVLIGTAALVAFLINAGIVPAIPQSWLWTGALAIGWGTSFWFGWANRSVPGACSLSNRTVAAAWLSCGIFLTLYWLTILVTSLIMPADGISVGVLSATICPVAFGLYGLAFFVTATVSNQPWYRWVSAGSWAVSSLLILSLALNIGAYFLIASIGTFTVVAAPGIHMLRNQPSQIV